MPELYDMVESYDNADYVIRIKKNTTLANKLHDELEALKQTGKSTSKISCIRLNHGKRNVESFTNLM